MELSHCTCTVLRGATRAISRAYDAALRPSGLRMTQFSILSRVTALQRPLLGQLAEALVMDRTTLARNLQPLRRDGLVRLEAGIDKREALVCLTPAGSEALERARPLWEAAGRRMAGKMGEEQLILLRQALSLVTEAGRQLAEEDLAA